MKPEEFLDTASSLVDSQSEADLRTSISRSYYAVILFYRNYIASKLNIPPKRIDSVHTFIPRCFEASPSPEAKKIGERIGRSKADRHIADYNLSRTVSKIKAEDSLRLARGLIETAISSTAEKSVLEQAVIRAKAERWINPT